MKMLVSNIQRFSLHDGPGIRTTVFFMGCSLKCPWCCNPENLTSDIKTYIDNNGKETVYGEEYSIKELENEILKDRAFFDEDGGVTYSGGEALLYLKYAKPLLENLHKQNIHQCVETSLNVPVENLKNIIEYIDLFYVDLKIVDKIKFSQILNGDIDLVKTNLELLKKNNKKFIIRVPLVKGYTLNQENLVEIKKLIDKFKPTDVEVFGVHNLGKSKYVNLNKEYEDFENIEEHIIEQVYQYLTK